MILVSGLFVLLVFLALALGPSLVALTPSATITGSASGVSQLTRQLPGRTTRWG